METIIVNIDSRTRDINVYPNHSKFNYNLSKNGIPNIKNIVELKISSIEFPNTSYFFTKKNQNTSITISDITYTIDDGNYNSDDIIETLNDLVPSDVNFYINKNTGKVLINSTNKRKFSFENNSKYQSLGELLGFENDIYFIEGTCESENIPNVIGENYFFLKVNDLGHVLNGGKRYIQGYYDSTKI